MKGKDVVHSSNSDEWGTPQALFDWLNVYHAFKLDAAASRENTKCRRYYSEKNSALGKNWIDKLDSHEDSVWLNPPYSLLDKFVQEVNIQVSLNDIPVVMLAPARTDTVWFHNACAEASRIYLIKGRLRFEGAKNSAPFPSCFIMWNACLTDSLIYTGSRPCVIETLCLPKGKRGF